MAAKKKSALGDDPLFNPVIEDQELETIDESSEEVTNERIEEVKQTIRDMRHEVKKFEQRKKNREDDYQRMTFIVKRDLLEKFKDYCFTERISQKEGIELVFSEFLKDKDDLISHPERPKQVHKRN